MATYNNGSHLDPDDFEDSISYVYCSARGRNDHSPELRNYTTYNFEEWCRMRNHQSYARELNFQKVQERFSYFPLETLE